MGVFRVFLRTFGRCAFCRVFSGLALRVSTFDFKLSPPREASKPAQLSAQSKPAHLRTVEACAKRLSGANPKVSTFVKC